MTGTGLDIEGGRRFGCTACGNCCMQDGYVYMKEGEVERMAAHLGKTVGEFWRDYRVHAHPADDEPVIEAKDGKGCPLLTADRRCSVHPVKPVQCSTWPFWRDMVEDVDTWTKAKSYCPGLDAPTGQLYSRKEILAIAREKRGT